MDTDRNISGWLFNGSEIDQDDEGDFFSANDLISVSKALICSKKELEPSYASCHFRCKMDF